MSTCVYSHINIVLVKILKMHLFIYFSFKIFVDICALGRFIKVLSEKFKFNGSVNLILKVVLLSCLFSFSTKLMYFLSFIG